jgi:hypothetical protein
MMASHGSSENADIRHRFTNHPPTGMVGSHSAECIMDDLTAEFIIIGEALAQWLPESREKSLALTKLEEASMWAKASVARNQG